MSQRRVNETSLTATADALRAKLGTSDPITWVENEGFKEAVESIQTDSGGADVSGVTATETEVLENAIFVDAHGEYKEGTIPRNGDTSATFDGIEVKSVDIPAGYTTGGTVTLDGTIDGHVDDQATLIAQIAEALENKAAGGGGPLQAKTVYPSHTEQIIAPDEDYYGLVSVTVKPVPRVKAAEMSVSARTYPQYYLFNGVRLPEFPFGVIDQYPYAWIRNNTTSGYYELIMADAPFYYLYNGSSSAGFTLVDQAKTQPKYRVSISGASSATAWEWENNASNTWWGIFADRPCLWSNHDIPNGSADATDIYFEGTEPVLTE